MHTFGMFLRWLHSYNELHDLAVIIQLNGAVAYITLLFNRHLYGSNITGSPEV